MAAPDLYWLPKNENWREALSKLDSCENLGEVWRSLVALANTRVDFLQTQRLDSILQRHFASDPPLGIETKPIRLAVLGSSTQNHLIPSIRVAALRRGIWLTTYESAYGQYFQELLNTDSGLYTFRPDAVLIAVSYTHLMFP